MLHPPVDGWLVLLGDGEGGKDNACGKFINVDS